MEFQLVKVDAVPKIRRYKPSAYKVMLEAFLQSKDVCVRVDCQEKGWLNISQGLKLWAKREDSKSILENNGVKAVKVLVREKKVYLMKVK